MAADSPHRVQRNTGIGNAWAAAVKSASPEGAPCCGPAVVEYRLRNVPMAAHTDRI